MCRNLGLCCWLLLFVASLSNPQKNSMNDDKQNENLTVQYDEFHANSTKSERIELIRYHSRENSTKDYDEVQYEPHTNFSTNNRENDGSTQYEFRAYTMKSHEESNPMDPRSKINGESNFTLYELRNFTIGDDNIVLYKNIVSYEMCNNSECLQLCCPLGDHLIQEKCVAGKDNYSFSGIYRYTSDSSQSENKRLDQVFRLVVHDPCLETGRRLLDPKNSPDDEYVLFANGSLYRPHQDEFIPSKSYCLVVVNGDYYNVAICKNKKIYPMKYPIFVTIGLVVSLPFLLMTFVVYTILPELQNMHGYTLRAHVASLFVTYSILPFYHRISVDKMGYSVCVPLAFILHFSFSSSFLWLNVTCFDIWWTFSIFRSMSGKQLERKKFIIYSIYAWGSASILTIVCAIMDYVPSIPKDLVRPEFCTETFWLSNKAGTFYFYLPMGITVLCNIFFFIATALKIACQKKDTAFHLKDSESERHDDNKQRFIMYLKLFILMGITWVMEVMSWVVTSLPDSVWYPTDVINTLQGFIIFVIFVWRGKIKRLLLQRLGWQNCSLFCRNSKSKDCYTIHDRYTSTITKSGTECLQEIN